MEVCKQTQVLSQGLLVSKFHRLALHRIIPENDRYIVFITAEMPSDRPWDASHGTCHQDLCEWQKVQEANGSMCLWLQPVQAVLAACHKEKQEVSNTINCDLFVLNLIVNILGNL